MDTIKGEKARKKTKGKPFIPDEIVINILIRLPARRAMRCRLVCKGWRDLTSTRDFVDSNLINSISTILVANPRAYSRLDLFALDKWWEPAGTRLSIRKFPFYSGKYCNRSRALFSHSGLIVLQEEANNSSQAKFIILNPTRPSLESVRISFPGELYRSKIYGVYFHPSLKEYCSLWEIHESYPFYAPPKRIQYKILNLGSNPSLKTIINPFSSRVMMLDAIPVYMNNHIYWKLECEHVYKYHGHNDIMEFDIISEEFMVIPCPVPKDTECSYNQTYLLNIDGILSFLLIVSRKITIWRLEDRATHLWTAGEYPFSLELCYGWDIARGIAVVDGKLALRFERRLVVCNLMDGTVKRSRKKKYCAHVWFLSHQMSLASLSDCKHTIKIYQDANDDKVVAV